MTKKKSKYPVVTTQRLQNRFACGDGIDLFKEVFPGGKATLDLPTVKKWLGYHPRNLLTMQDDRPRARYLRWALGDLLGMGTFDFRPECTRPACSVCACAKANLERWLASVDPKKTKRKTTKKTPKGKKVTK
jgi:hypothetical protein